MMPLGGVQLREDLEGTMEYVLGKIQDFQLTKAFKETKNAQDQEQFFMVPAIFSKGEIGFNILLTIS